MRESPLVGAEAVGCVLRGTDGLLRSKPDYEEEKKASSTELIVVPLGTGSGRTIEVFLNSHHLACSLPWRLSVRKN